MLIVESQSLDVHRNLAMEEYLMDRVAGRGPILFLWRSDCAVVIGKNQNPWRECRLDRMEQDGVPLARRISGGGAVYHDGGNLNYCVIVDRGEYKKYRAYELVIQALAPFGIRASLTGKSNLSVDGLKFSGNAFCFRKGRVMHHGTLLLETDLERLGRYLGPTVDGIETRAIASEPAEVVNLDLGIDEVSRALIETFPSLYGGGEPERLEEDGMDPGVLREMVERQMSVDWQYGATPRFSVELGASRLEVEQGMVVSVAGPDRAWENKAFGDIVRSRL